MPEAGRWMERQRWVVSEADGLKIAQHFSAGVSQTSHLKVRGADDVGLRRLLSKALSGSCDD